MAKKKIKKQKSEDQKERVHVRLDGPVSKRKSILNCAIEVVELMKRQDKIRELRVERHKEMENYHLIMKDFRHMVTLLGLKDVKIKGMEENKVVIVQPRKTVVKKVKAAPKPTGLDAQLNALRSKIQTL